MPFKIGEQVVHPHHGVGTITNLAERQFEPGKPRAYYEISITSGSLWVPVDEPSLGLRQLAARRELAYGRRILESKPSPLDIPTREVREQLSRRLRKGTLRAQCEVVRDLTALGWRRPLHGAMADFRLMALSVLSEEWGIVAGISLDQAKEEINAHLNKGRQMHFG